MKSKFTAALVILTPLLAAIVLAREFGAVAGFVSWFLLASAMGFSAQQAANGFSLGITISSDLKFAKMLDAALYGFEETVMPLNAFSKAFYDVPLEGTDEIVVPYYPIESAASRDFTGTYIFDSASKESRKITVDQRKYQSLSYTSAELRRQPRMSPEEYGLLKGRKLGIDVVKDILSIVTAANFGAAVFTGASSTFDSDDTADIQKACDDAFWPEIGRSLILNTAYNTALLKDPDVKTSPSTAITEDAMKRGAVPELNGFAIRKTTGLPGNGENLVGAAVYQSAILVGFSPIMPAPDVMAQLTRYLTQVSTSGLTLEYRQWGTAGTDSVFRVIESNYGKALGEAAALKRLVSA